MTEVVPAARELVRALADAPSSPVQVLITGGLGTGKTTTLAAIREVLRAAGVDGATVVDDADELDDSELQALTALAQRSDATLVVACQACEQRPALRELLSTLERHRPRIALGPLSRAEVGRHTDLHEPDRVSAIMAATAGLPFLVDGARGAEDPAKAAYFTLVERLRRCEEPVLDALLVTSLSAGLGPADLAAALDVELDRARELTDRAYATGLVAPRLGGRFHSVVHRAVAQILGAARHRAVESALLRSQVELGTLATDLAVRLAEHGMRDPALAAVLASAARDAAQTLDTEPSRLAQLYRAARAAGAEGLDGQFVTVLARCGAHADAAAVADELLSSTDPDTRSAAVRVAAALAMNDGNAEQAAELVRWAGPVPELSAPGALVLVATGDLEAARDALAVPPTGPPTSTARAERNLVEGLLLSVDRPYGEAMSRLGRSVGVPPPDGVSPDSPAAVVALAALHAGDPIRARTVLARAAHPPDPVFAHRHRLIQAWTNMQDGRLQAAAADLATVPEGLQSRRDALWRAAVSTGLARRHGDTGAMQQHWYAAVDVLSGYSVDLFALLPLGELWIAAARMRQEDRLAHQRDQGFALLARLGNPAAWSLPLHWAGVHAAILANAPEAMAPHGQALTALADGNGFARALADAGRAWLRVLAGQGELDEVAAAARGLARFGLTSDATRLAGQAALQATDGRVSAALLQVARDLKVAAGDDGSAEPETDGEVEKATAASAPAGPAAVPAVPGRSLSEREREVAELLLRGLPYRDIGAQLFISAKTVEHHVARIRRRLGAESRSEMLSMLRAMLS